MDRLRTVLRQNGRRSSREIIDKILASVESFRQTGPQEDDVTLIVLKSQAGAPAPS